MSTLWLLMLVLVCPLMMVLMMRGMRGGGHGKDDGETRDAAVPRDQADPHDVRLAQLEREVAELRAARAAEADRLHLTRP
jgi:hypothetical protein